MRKRSSSASGWSRSPTRCASPGFTLVELLVALTVTALVAGAVYFTLSTALAGAERNRVVQQAARSQRNARMVLSALLRSARADVVTEDARFRGVDAAYAPSGTDELRLVGALGFPFARFSEGDAVRAHLWLDATPQREGGDAALALLVEVAPWPGGPRGRGANQSAASDTIVLFARLSGAEITYRDPISGIWVDNWDRPGLLPAAVAIAFHSLPPMPPLIVNLPMRRVG